ncbi:glycoside hydrolase family 43 protein [Marinilabilia rubra]|uniref:Glycoside hydrolase family 43 protein n=1 Tax=Marinilabilia rubra TaxID=2162893 RepID=A0A2U2BBZ7_9BACT|nr:glycoside hydrolase family 43 protein [Marinilabilia rubra]PWE00595.1 glycoside hydrolase family 43 protein [Marinilabilia rubra]
MGKKLLLLFIFICSITVYSHESRAQILPPQNSFVNPIIPGGFPDPSICKVDDTFYIVNSSFEYFPGLPIHKSKDLINWELIGYGLHREEQCTNEVNLVDVQSNGGIHAPTIRYSNGRFYIITTNVYYNEADQTTHFVNFIITAENPEGPWSDPHVLKGAPGIDPDIIFDDDGRVWYVGTHSPENPNFEGEGEIWLQEIDMDNWELTGPRHYLWRGACGGVWVEGPHMYKRDNRYYLMVAEGGTSFNHAVMIAVSDSITGPFLSNERNPILTSRHLSYDNWVHSTGHADLIELNDGRWYMVALGIRGDEDRASNMGRETHLVSVQWEKEPFPWKETQYEWPVAAPQTGRVERFNPVPFDATFQKRNPGFIDNFGYEKLKLAWNFRRVPTSNMYSLSDNKGHLRLYTHPNVIKERGRASLMGFRQTESDFEYQAKMNFHPKSNNSEAGICLFQKDDNYFTLTVVKENNKYMLQLKLAEPNSKPRILKKQEIPNYSKEITFMVKSENHSYLFYYSLNGAEFNLIEQTKANYILSKKYTGAYLGVYATSNGANSQDYADFDWVNYKGFARF